MILRGLAVATLLLFCTGSPLSGEWPLVWDFDGRSDTPVAAVAGAGGDLWVLSDSNVQGGSMSRGVLLRIASDSEIIWATDDPLLTAPAALAVRADGAAIAIGWLANAVQLTAFDADGAIAWSRSRSGLTNEFGFRGPTPAPSWDPEGNPAGGGAWRIPVGLGGDFAVLSFAPNGEPLPDIVWSPPAGEGGATSLLPRPGGSLLVAGIVENVSPPGWWIVALDAKGGVDWSRFEDGETQAGAFSGAFLLSADPVRVWADDETMCGNFSLRVWSLDAKSGAPLWASTWPTGGSPECESFTPESVTIAGGRILASGIAKVPASGASFDPTAVSIDAATGELQWARVFDGATTGLRTAIASPDGSALLASSLFPNPSPGPTPLWLASWDRDGAACAPPLELLPARIQSSFALPDEGLLLVGKVFSGVGGTADDLVLQRVDNPCAALFVDGFEAGDTLAWSASVP
ncbi:MAG: PQQ-binding-like beta-propeller repeat protein [Thermoanaerobaculia bacterium]